MDAAAAMFESTSATPARAEARPAVRNIAITTQQPFQRRPSVSTNSDQIEVNGLQTCRKAGNLHTRDRAFGLTLVGRRCAGRQVRSRVHRLLVDAKLEVQVGSSRVAGGSLHPD